MSESDKVNHEGAWTLLHCSRSELYKLRELPDFPKEYRNPRADGTLGRKIFFSRSELLAWDKRSKNAQRSSMPTPESADAILRNLGRTVDPKNTAPAHPYRPSSPPDHDHPGDGDGDGDGDDEPDCVAA